MGTPRHPTQPEGAPDSIALPRRHLPAADQFLYWPPQFQAYGYRVVDQLFASRTVRRGPSVLPLPRGPEPRDFVYRSAGVVRTIDDFMIHNVVAGLLVIKDGAIVLERYGLGLAESDRWSTMSTVKSISAMLVGAAVHDGLLPGIDVTVGSYVPMLAGTAYGEVSVRHLLTMSSGIAWSEVYADPDSDVNRYSAALARREAGAVLRQLAVLPRQDAPGTRWQYNTGNSFLLGCVLRQAVGRPLADYLSERIWQPAGMEFDAFYTVESPEGQEIAGSRAGMALRDLGRFARFVLDDGCIAAARVLPEGWVDAAFEPAFRFSGADLDVLGVRSNRLAGYGYSWWIGEDGCASALGFAGQRILIDRAERFAVVTLSAFPQAPHVPSPIPDREAEVVALTDALRSALRG